MYVYIYRFYGKSGDSRDKWRGKRFFRPSPRDPGTSSSSSFFNPIAQERPHKSQQRVQKGLNMIIQRIASRYFELQAFRGPGPCARKTPGHFLLHVTRSFHVEHPSDPHHQHLPQSSGIQMGQSIAIQMGGGLRYKWEADCDTHGRSTESIPFPQSLGALQALQYKLEVYCNTSWRCIAILLVLRSVAGVASDIPKNQTSPADPMKFKSSEGRGQRVVRTAYCCAGLPWWLTGRCPAECVEVQCLMPHRILRSKQILQVVQFLSLLCPRESPMPIAAWSSVHLSHRPVVPSRLGLVPCSSLQRAAKRGQFCVFVLLFRGVSCVGVQIRVSLELSEQNAHRALHIEFVYRPDTHWSSTV